MIDEMECFQSLPKLQEGQWATGREVQSVPHDGM